MQPVYFLQFDSIHLHLAPLVWHSLSGNLRTLQKPQGKVKTKVSKRPRWITSPESYSGVTIPKPHHKFKTTRPKQREPRQYSVNISHYHHQKLSFMAEAKQLLFADYRIELHCTLRTNSERPSPQHRSCECRFQKFTGDSGRKIPSMGNNILQ